MVTIAVVSAMIMIPVGRLASLTTPPAPPLAPSMSIALAQALTRTLNTHDLPELTDLFTDEDGGPTVMADRYAWLKSEIRLWAQLQADKNIHIDAYDYRTTEQGAAWSADVYRDDWTAVGVDPLRVTNSIWVHNGKIANFTEVARDSIDTEQLGPLWRPGSSPEQAIDAPWRIWRRSVL